MNKIIHGDCLNRLDELSNDSIDLLLTDPPYFVMKGDDEKWDLFDSLSDFMKFTERWLNKCYKLLKNNKASYIFWSQKRMKDFWDINTNFNIERMLIWNNPCLTKGFSSDKYLFMYTPIFYLSKGKIDTFNGSLNNKTNIDVFRFPKPQSNWSNETRYHPNQKPLDLLTILINNSTEIGDTVLDPFLGSGSTAVACKELDREYIGIEKSKHYCNISKERLSKVNDNKLDRWM